MKNKMKIMLVALVALLVTNTTFAQNMSKQNGTWYNIKEMEGFNAQDPRWQTLADMEAYCLYAEGQVKRFKSIGDDANLTNSKSLLAQANSDRLALGKELYSKVAVERITGIGGRISTGLGTDSGLFTEAIATYDTKYLRIFGGGGYILEQEIFETKSSATFAKAGIEYIFSKKKFNAFRFFINAYTEYATYLFSHMPVGDKYISGTSNAWLGGGEIGFEKSIYSDKSLAKGKKVNILVRGAAGWKFGEIWFAGRKEGLSQGYVSLGLVGKFNGHQYK